MEDSLYPSEMALLAAVRDGIVEYAPGRGRHSWFRPSADPDRLRPVDISARMHTLVTRGLVQPPQPRASGIARVSETGAALLHEAAA